MHHTKQRAISLFSNIEKLSQILSLALNINNTHHPHILSQA